MRWERLETPRKLCTYSSMGRHANDHARSSLDETAVFLATGKEAVEVGCFPNQLKC